MGWLICLLGLCSLGSGQQDVITEIVVHGNRRIPAETVRARVFSRPGDIYDQAAIERDFNSLWNTGYFEDIRFEREQNAKGWILHIYLKERPTIREINYVGLSSVSTSDVLDRFKERKVGLSVESQYDPTKIKKAEVTLKQLLAEHGRQFATIRTEVRPIPPAAVGITFVVREGPKVKVGHIRFRGNKHINDRTLRAAMKNLRPIGIPHSIFLESLFAKTYDATKLEEDTERVRAEFQNRGYFKVVVQEPKTVIRDSGHKGFHIPLVMKGAGKAVDITIPIEEGEVYDQHLWEVSLLRLNQLGYFEQLKPEDPNVTERHLNEKDATVDLTLKLKEKGKNQIGLTGGVSGLSGSFIGLSYSTNNFLGLGETLTVQANIGNRQRDLMFGFTEPYLRDRPLQLGFTVYTRKYNFDQAQQAEIFSGQRLNLPSPLLQNLQNYTQASTGFSLSLSYPLHRSFKRVGLTYAFDRSSVIAVSEASKTLFTNLAFRGISGPNSLSGIITSKLLPNFSFNTTDSAYFPKSGTSLYLGGELAGLGGTVRSVRPIVQYKHFIPLQNRRNTIGFNLQASFLTGYGGLVAPPFERFYMGGDNDLRGFDIRSIAPVAFLPDKSVISLRNTDGSIVPKDPSNPLRGAYSIPLPLQRIVFPGGDTSVVTNLEYRITIAGPVALAPFMDVGINPILRNSQLRINPGQLSDINNTAFGCPALDVALNCLGGQFQNFSEFLKPAASTNWIPPMSTSLDMQVFIPSLT